MFNKCLENKNIFLLNTINRIPVQDYAKIKEPMNLQNIKVY